jgi:hypothetical protein
MRLQEQIQNIITGTAFFADALSNPAGDFSIQKSSGERGPMHRTQNNSVGGRRTVVRGHCRAGQGETARGAGGGCGASSQGEKIRAS